MAFLLPLLPIVLQLGGAALIGNRVVTTANKISGDVAASAERLAQAHQGVGEAAERSAFALACAHRDAADRLGAAAIRAADIHSAQLGASIIIASNNVSQELRNAAVDSMNIIVRAGEKWFNEAMKEILKPGLYEVRRFVDVTERFPYVLGFFVCLAPLLNTLFLMFADTWWPHLRDSWLFIDTSVPMFSLQHVGFGFAFVLSWFLGRQLYFAILQTFLRNAMMVLRLNRLEHGLHPIGSIVFYFGQQANIPPAYSLCDGQNGTPDLRDKFIVGAGPQHPHGQSGAGSLTRGANVDAIKVDDSHSGARFVSRDKLFQPPWFAAAYIMRTA